MPTIPTLDVGGSAGFPSRCGPFRTHGAMNAIAGSLWSAGDGAFFASRIVPRWLWEHPDRRRARPVPARTGAAIGVCREAGQFPDDAL